MFVSGYKKMIIQHLFNFIYMNRIFGKKVAWKNSLKSINDKSRTFYIGDETQM